MRLVCFSPPQLSSNASCPFTVVNACCKKVKPQIPFLLRPHAILSRTMEADAQFMQEALAEARAAAAAGEVPIGAVLVHNGKVLARAGNRTIRDCAATAH